MNENQKGKSAYYEKATHEFQACPYQNKFLL